MKQVTKSLLSLALLGLIAGGVGLFAWLRTEGASGARTDGEKPLVLFDRARITAFELEEGKGSFRVERMPDGSWDVATPVRIVADPTSIKEVMDALARLRVTKRFSDEDPPPSMAAMGLETPLAVFRAFLDDDARPLRIEFGNRSEFNSQEYVRYTAPGDEPIVLMLKSGSRRSLMRTPEQLYDRRVLGAGTEDVVRLRIEPRQPTADRVRFTLERSGPLSFRAIEPFEGEVDALVLRRVLEGLSGAPVSTWLTLDAQGDLSPHGLDEPSITVTAWIRPKNAPAGAPLVERKVLIGAPEGEDPEAFVRVAREDQPWVGTAHTILWHALPHSVEALKNKRVTLIERSLVERIELDLESGEHVVVERDEKRQDAWRLLAPESRPAKPQVVNALLLTVSELPGVARALEGEAVSDPKQLEPLGVADDARRLRLVAKNGELLATLRIGKVEGEDVFVFREGADFVARVAKQNLADIPLKAIELFE